MTAQSHRPVILLTRPANQSARFAAALLARFPGLGPGLAIVTSPLIAPVFPAVSLPDRNWTAVIFTSETAVRAAQRIAADGFALPPLAFCVGDQTARAAQDAGFRPISAMGDAAALVALVRRQGMAGPLLYLHGRETRGDVAAQLNSAGIETVPCHAYTQDPQALSPEATALLQGKDPVLAPVFSARTAEILASECARIAATAPLHIVAISRAAGAAFPPAVVSVAAAPDASAMLSAIASRLSDAPPP